MAILRMSMLPVLLILAAGLQAQGPDCEDAIGCVVIGPDEPVSIGYMLVTSGAVAFLGEDSLGGIALALLARDNQLLGRDIELLGEDSLCTPEGGQTAAENLVSDGQVLGIIGTSCSSAAVAALPIISRAGYVMISPSNTTPGLTEADKDRRRCVATRLLPHFAERPPAGRRHGQVCLRRAGSAQPGNHP